MKIVFFGTSHGAPEAGRRCSAAMIEVGEARYFIDMGTQAVEGLADRGIPAESVRAILVTHLHNDHTDGLLSFLSLCSWRYTEADPTIYLPGDTEGARGAIAAWLSCNGVTLRPFDFCHVEAGLIFDDGILRVTAYRTLHTDASFAYLVEAEGKRVLFSGDLAGGGPAKDFPREVLDAPLDLAICESAHFPATGYLPLFAGNANLLRLCFNHYTPRHLASVEETMAALSGKIETFLAVDGMEIIL